jgi:hypothetical protein
MIRKRDSPFRCDRQPWRDDRAQAITKQRLQLVAISISRSLILAAINGNDRDDATNLHPHFRGPTKETFIEA